MDKPIPIIKAVGNAAVSGAKFVASGCARVPAAVARDRLNICKACDYYNADRITCRKCRCFLRAKVHLPHEKCPVGRWRPADTPSR